MPRSPRSCSPTEKLYTLQDVASLFSVDIKTVSRWLGNFKVRVVGPTKRTLRIPQSSLDRLLKLRIVCPSCRRPVTIAKKPVKLDSHGNN